MTCFHVYLVMSCYAMFNYVKPWYAKLCHDVWLCYVVINKHTTSYFMLFIFKSCHVYISHASWLIRSHVKILSLGNVTRLRLNQVKQGVVPTSCWCGRIMYVSSSSSSSPSVDAEGLCFMIPRFVRDLANLNFLWNARIWYVHKGPTC